MKESRQRNCSGEEKRAKQKERADRGEKGRERESEKKQRERRRRRRRKKERIPVCLCTNIAENKSKLETVRLEKPEAFMFKLNDRRSLLALEQKK